MPRGRPREFDRERALDGAMDAFWRNGVARTTTRRLEAAIGINASSLYNAFGSKDGLLAEVVARYQRGLQEHVLSALGRTGSGLGAIDAFLARLARWISDDGRCGCLVSRLIGEGDDHGEVVAGLVAGYRRQLRAGLRAALQRAAAAGEIAPGTVDRRVEVLTGMVLGLNLAAQGPAGAAGVRRLAAAYRREVAGWASGPIEADLTAA